MPLLRSCLRCGALSDKSYCPRHRHLQGGTGQRGSMWRWRKLRHAVLERDGRRCTWMKVNGERCDAQHGLEVDHVKPVSDGGTDALENLRTLCRMHHQQSRRGPKP